MSLAAHTVSACLIVEDEREALPAALASVAFCDEVELLGTSLGLAAQDPDDRTRMFRRGAYRHDEGRTVHEGIKPCGTTLAMQGDMVHRPATSWREALGDAWRHTRLEAATSAPPVTARTAAVGVVARPAAKAAYRLVVGGAWRDGWRGWVEVGLDAGAGTDGELVAPPISAAPTGRFASRATDGRGPLALARALLGSVQVRTVDAILLCDPGARRACRWSPGTVGGTASSVRPSEPPAAAVARLTAELHPV